MWIQGRESSVPLIIHNDLVLSISCPLGFLPMSQNVELIIILPMYIFCCDLQLFLISLNSRGKELEPMEIRDKVKGPRTGRIV